MRPAVQKADSDSQGERRAATPNPSWVGGDSLSPNRPVRHRVVEVKSEDRGMARKRRIEDHFGRHAFPTTDVPLSRSNYRDDFQGRSALRSPAIYPKDNLNINKSAKVDFSTSGRDSYLDPQRLPERVVRQTQAHLQSNSLFAEMMGGKFEGRTEKQDRFGYFSVVLR